MTAGRDAVDEFIIEHHGVKGQQWGVRRKSGGMSKAPNTTFQKNPKRLSDAELGKRIKRMELEKKYAELNKPIKTDGQKYVKGLLEGTGKTAVGAVVGGAATFFVQRELKKRFSEKV